MLLAALRMIGDSMPRTILVFVKYPEPGQVKTRLAASIGESNAATAYRQLVAEVFSKLRKARPDRICIAVDPATREREIREWLGPYLSAYFGEIAFYAQRGGDLGERLRHAVDDVYADTPRANLLVVGTDCIHLDRQLLVEAWSALEGETDIVFGPSADGGYYLVGLSEPRPLLFTDIPWSTEATLAASLAVAAREGWSVHSLDERFDVDTAEEWNRVSSALSERPCVFFDRDGVINESPGPGYVESVDGFHLRPGIAEVLAWLEERGWNKILVTSQKCVGKEIISAAELDRIHEHMQDRLRREGAALDAIYAYTGEPDCPYPPKPEPGMVESACESFFISRRRSWLVGDADRDIAMGKSAGLAGTIRMKTELPIGVEADSTVTSPEQLIDLFLKIL